MAGMHRTHSLVEALQPSFLVLPVGHPAYQGREARAQCGSNHYASNNACSSMPQCHQGQLMMWPCLLSERHAWGTRWSALLVGLGLHRCCWAATPPEQIIWPGDRRSCMAAL